MIIGSVIEMDEVVGYLRHNGKKCVAVLTTSPRFQRADKGVN